MEGRCESPAIVEADAASTGGTGSSSSCGGGGGKWRALGGLPGRRPHL